MTLFNQGTPQTIELILADRDQRVQTQQQLMTTFSKDTVLVLKLNIPGAIKFNQAINQLFNVALRYVEETLAQHHLMPHHELIWRQAAGATAFLVVAELPQELKNLAIFIEDQWSLGRILDLDVMANQRTWSRHDLGLAPRQCMICERPAKVCARSRNHSVQELQVAIDQLWQEFCHD